jgi:hypothetical protein
LGCLAANLGWVSRHAAAAQCALKRTGSVDISIRNDHVMVPITINGHRATMELDTASAITMVWDAYMKRFGLKWDHSFEGKVARPPLMMVGSQGFRGPALIVWPDKPPPSEDTAPDIGHLGMDLLGIEDFELDFANNKLNFYSTDHCPGAVVYWTDRYSSAPVSREGFQPGAIHYPMELQGQKILAVLSTDTPVTRLGTDVTRKLFGFDESSSGIETENDGAGHATAHYRAMALTGSGITITNAKIQLVPKRNEGVYDCDLMTNRSDGVAYYFQCSEEAPLTVGLDVLRRLHLYFATHEHVLYFSDAAATK